MSRRQDPEAWLENIVTKNRRPPTRWVYVYEIVPPDAEQALPQIGALLEQANATARRLRASWTGTLVVGTGRARILVVSESPSQRRRSNRVLEAGLRRLEVEFTLTVPLAMEDDITPIAGPRHSL